MASPRARKLAKELKVDLSSLRGSGPHGRIVAEDVEAAAGKAVAKAPVAPTAAPPPAPHSCRYPYNSYGCRPCPSRSGAKGAIDNPAKRGGAKHGGKPGSAYLPCWLHHHNR
ncbi:E3 binding domain-containing protein [Leptothermofonsia sp. ETS-13]|uniref:E3 binding domain-containing protein n=1 Tax=Leptothermofonsia sp. ETS-13 TaxID=3035696 RepID=UPI003BA072B2